MKIAISANGDTISAEMDSRFGRTKNFILWDSESKAISSFDNIQNLNAVQGAGIQSAMNVAEAGAEAVITGHCGPKAFRVLSEAEIKVYLTTATTVAQAIELWCNGELEAAQQADVEGHWA